MAHPASVADSGEAGAAEYETMALLALAAYLCCACMGGSLVHMASFVGSVCGSPAIGATSLLIAMIFGAIGRVSFGVAADRLGALTSYAMASATQTASVLLFPALGDSLSFMALSAVFGFGFAGNMTSLSLCVRDAVPAHRFGGALGAVMMVAWAGMAASSYVGGRLFDATLSYHLSFILEGVAGALNLMVLALLSFRQRTVLQRSIGSQSYPL
jgi:MFS family permease